MKLYSVTCLLSSFCSIYTTAAAATTPATAVTAATTTVAPAAPITSVTTHIIQGGIWSNEMVSDLRAAVAEVGKVPLTNAVVALNWVTLSTSYGVDDRIAFNLIRQGIAVALGVSMDTVALTQGTRLLEEGGTLQGRRLAQTVNAKVQLTPQANIDLAAKAVQVLQAAADATKLQASLANVAKLTGVAKPIVGHITQKMSAEVRLTTSPNEAGSLGMTLTAVNTALGKVVGGQAEPIDPQYVIGAATTTVVLVAGAGTTTPGLTYTLTPGVVSKDTTDEVQQRVVGAPKMLLMIGLFVGSAIVAIVFCAAWRQPRQSQELQAHETYRGIATNGQRFIPMHQK